MIIDVDRELDWFFNESFAALNIKSNFAYVQQIKAYKIPISDSSLFEESINNILNYVDKHRKISKALSKLNKEEYITLQASFQPVQFPPQIKKVLGNDGLIALLSINYDLLIDLCNKIISKKANNQDKILLSQLRVDIKKKIKQSKTNYLKARNEL